MSCVKFAVYKTLDYGSGMERTSYRVAHRHIVSPPLQHYRKQQNIRYYKDEFAMKQSYRTSSSIHSKMRRTRSSHHERHPCSSNMHYMTFAEDKMDRHSHGATIQPEAETKRMYRQPRSLSAIDPHLTCNHSKLPDSAGYREFDLNKNRGSNEWLDPYVTTDRFHHRNFPLGNRSALHNTNVWSDLIYPKISGDREIWMPLDRPVRHVSWGNFKYDDRLNIIMPNRPFSTPSMFKSETRKKFVPIHRQYTSTMLS